MKKNLVLAAACAVASLNAITAAEPAVIPPVNAPAEVKWDAATGKLTLN